MIIPKAKPPLYRLKIRHIEIVLYSNLSIGVFDHHNFHNDKLCKSVDEFNSFISDRLKTKEVEEVIVLINKLINNKVFL